MAPVTTGSTSTDRDVIYALRTTHQYQTNLINLADHKANILIGLSLVTFSILLTKATWILEQEGMRLSAITTFAAIQLATVLTAIWVVLPKLTGVQKFASLQDAPNPMFFGFFTQFSQSEFSDYAASVLQHDQHARALLIRDIYQIGHILRRKYKGLRIAYLLQSVSLVILFSAVLSQFVR